jgi:integration host factor subunit beta
MTKRDLIEELLKQFPRFARRDAEVMVNTVFDTMTEALCRGDRIEIRGFGSFVVKQRQARRPEPQDRLARVRPGDACRSSRWARLRLRVDGKPGPRRRRSTLSRGPRTDGRPVGAVAGAIGGPSRGCIFTTR